MEVKAHEERGSWLCPDPGDRERALEMDHLLRPPRMLAMGFLAGALLLSSPWVGWWTVPVLGVLFVAFAVVERMIEKSAFPEWWMAGTWLFAQCALAGGIIATGAAHSPVTAWLAIATVTLPVRFTRRGVYSGMTVTVVLLAIATIGVDFDEVVHNPPLFLFPLALIGAVVTLTLPLRTAELKHRSEAVIDQLTGLLNRKALEQRVAELEVQSRMTGQPVGVLVCDIDHFKSVNDTYGHAMGDAVLEDLAYRIRKALRAYDLAYRLGGEEFVVLVPGADRTSAAQLAERLRLAVAAEEVEGVAVTMSFGVAASGRDGLDFDRLFAEADEALYRAKAGGRDRVATAGDHGFAALADDLAAATEQTQESGIRPR